MWMRLEKKKWARVRFQNRFGKFEIGDLAYEGETESVIRVERKAMKVPSPYGLIELTGVYETVKNEYIEVLT